MEAETVEWRDFLQSLCTTPPPSPLPTPPPISTGNRLCVSFSNMIAVSSKSRLIFSEMVSFRLSTVVWTWILPSFWLPSSSSILISLILKCSASALTEDMSPFCKIHHVVCMLKLTYCMYVDYQLRLYTLHNSYTLYGQEYGGFLMINMPLASR